MNSNAIINIFVFAVLALLWLGFAAALLLRPSLLAKTWADFRKLPLPVQILVGLLLLPLVAGLWVWNTRWPAWLRLALVAGLAWITLYTFFPRLPVA